MRNFIVTVNGTKYEVGVEEVGESASAAPVTTAATPAAPAVKPAAGGKGQKVTSPFPGLIKKLYVEDGASVKKDQPILVLEAMKMDNDITAPCDGTVTFNVQKGANVESDAVLAFIG